MWHSAGVSTIPILTNGTKRPLVQWAEYQARIPELGELDRWWGNGHDYGIAVICGSVSGNLEMTELEGDVASNADLMEMLESEAVIAGLDWLWQGLFQTYAEWTPSGGIHLIYRISDHPVPGNEKVARAADGKVRVETRGEGGYVIVAPTSGLCHPSGESWNLLGNSQPGQIPEITWSERNQLHDLLRVVFDEYAVGSDDAPAPAKALVPTSPGSPTAAGAGSRPGDEMANQMSWAEILEPFGWQFAHRHGTEEYWTRPGKRVRDGVSATTNYQDSGLLKVFTSSVPEFDTDATYTKFGAYAALAHRGDYRAAARDLAKRGFGSPSISPRAQGQVQPYIEEGNRWYSLDDVGNGQRMMEEPARNFPDLHVGDVHRWVVEEKKPRVWDGTCWVTHETAIFWETDDTTRRMMRSDDEDLQKCGARSRSWAKQKAMATAFYAQPGMSVSASDFDTESQYLNLRNGIFNLKSGDLHPHQPQFMLSQKFNASYDPDAKAVQWEQFLDRALPDREVRDYVQRCLGYTLLGDPSERAMFVIYGPSGTGKSTFLETLNHVFGQYGETAPAGTFRASRNQDDSAPTPALHQLRGKRFVTTSETSEGVQWNEELVKRYTGHDAMRSRGLFESYQTWRNEASIWMATNHAPRFTSDDRAIWNRVKLVPFTTVFLGEGQVLAMDDLLKEEADGILNWLLEGLAAYRERGLEEPESVTKTVNLMREQSDSVVRFLDDKAAEHAITFEASQSMSRADLYVMYQNWCRTAGERALGGARFVRRLAESGRPLKLSGDGRLVSGVGRIPGGWMVGG
jgi:putative DNA primase/helicase